MSTLRSRVREEANGVADQAKEAMERGIAATRAAIDRATELVADRLHHPAMKIYPMGYVSYYLLWPSVVATGALALYEAQHLELNYIRNKYGIKPYQITGHENFERSHRMFQHTAESLVTFIPSVYTFSLFVSPKWATVLGGSWILGRILYVYGHNLDPALQQPGYVVTYLSQLALLGGSLARLGQFALNYMHHVAVGDALPDTSGRRVVTVDEGILPDPRVIRK